MITLTLALIACDPIAPIKIKNQTNQDLIIYINRSKVGIVAPDTTINNRIAFLAPEYLIEAKNSQGEVIYSQKIVDKELQKLGDIIVITKSGP